MIHGAFHGALRGQIDEEVFGKLYDRRVVTRMVPYIAPYRKTAAIATLSMLVYIGTQLAVPWIIKIGIDGPIADGDFAGLTVVFGVFIGVAITNWASNYAQELAMAKSAQGVLYSLRRELFSHLQRLPVSFYDRNEVGRLMSRVQGDVSQLQEFLTLVVMTLGELMSLIGIVVLLLLLNLKLGLICMVVLPVLVVIMAIWQPFARKAFLRARRAISIVNGALNENITGVRVVQSMNRQGANMADFDVKNRENLNALQSATRLSSGLLPSVDILTGVAIGLALYFGSRILDTDPATGGLEIGVLIAFVMYIQRFFDPIRNLTMQYTQLQRSMASGERIFNLLDTNPDLVDAAEAETLPRLKGEVEFKDVSFSYVPGEDVLSNVSFHIDPGETVAIVGPTGAGKTTLVSLVNRFYDVSLDRGAILVDGRDIRKVTRNSLAGQMSMVLQEPFLFSGTIKQNIKYNHGDVSDEKMVEAAKAVGAHDFIIQLEDGYDTYLQERGVNLSVGQRQLLSFARAIVADPRILILDEATASIDSYTEMLIQRALQKVLKGRTAIVIAHRLSTIRGAEKIVVLHLGKIVEVGSHKELMENGGLYAHLYQMNYAAIEEPPPVGDGGIEDS